MTRIILVRHGHVDWLALEQGHEEEMPADERTGALKRSLSTEQPYYLNPPNL